METIAQHMSLFTVLALIAALIAIVGLVVVVALRRAPRSQAPVGVIAPQALEEPAPPLDKTIELDVPALTAAVQEAEAHGERDRLPGLYLSLAQRYLETGATAEATELLRKCIRAAAASHDKPVHAKARLVLGDVAHADGDPTTACEHWQIARAIFHELKRPGDHAEAERRMLSNGCPTDWVLTDF